MTISVVIPAYNEEKYLPLTLESLKKLDRQPDEVIVVDGSSTDKTDEVAKKYEVKILVVKHRGIGYARSQGLKAVSSDVVAFTDADTIVPHDWLTKIEETLNQPGVAGVFGTFRVPSGWWLYRFYVNAVQPILNQIYYLFGIPMAPGQNLAFWKNKAMEAGGFPEDFKIAEDIEMARRLMKVGKVIFRRDLVVKSSGRRGEEGPGLLLRTFKAFFIYFFSGKANRIGFPDIR